MHDFTIGGNVYIQEFIELAYINSVEKKKSNFTQLCDREHSFFAIRLKDTF